MYGSPPPSSKDLNIPFSPAGVRFKESEQQHRQQQQQQMSSGLLRYRSAPSSLFGEVCEDFLPVRPSSPETESIFARFLAATPDHREKQQQQQQTERANPSPQFPPPPPPPVSTAMEQRTAREHQDFPTAQQQMLFHTQHQQQQQQMPTHVSMAMEAEQMKSTGVGGAPNLIRQSSSPAGLFSHLNVENGYGMMRGMGGFRNGGGVQIGGEAGIPPASRLKGQISFSSRQSSIMSQISEMGSEGMGGGSSPEDSSLASGSSRGYIPGYPVGSWDDSSMLSDSYSGLKRPRDAADGSKFVPGLNQTDPQNGDLRNNVSGLNSSDMAAIEKFLQFQDSVPCKIRAKRGCATHPRSIAERVRRTRISERMRKLQELVPNMDKQTNTADMLDLAVEYIKDLQKQVKGLSDSRANCTCSSSKQKQYSNSSV